MRDLVPVGVVVDRLPVDAEEDRDLLGVEDLLVGPSSTPCYRPGRIEILMPRARVRIVPLVLGAACLLAGVIFVLPSGDEGKGTPLAGLTGFGDSVVSVLGWVLIALGVAILAAVVSDARKQRRSTKPTD